MAEHERYSRRVIVRSDISSRSDKPSYRATAGSFQTFNSRHMDDLKFLGIAIVPKGQSISKRSSFELFYDVVEAISQELYWIPENLTQEEQELIGEKGGF